MLADDFSVQPLKEQPMNSSSSGRHRSRSFTGRALRAFGAFGAFAAFVTLTSAAFVPTPALASDLVHAEVKGVDRSAGKVTLKHGEIKNLDMPSMTMIFRVRNPAELDQINVKDQVTFVAEKIDGAYTAHSITRLK